MRFQYLRAVAVSCAIVAAPIGLGGCDSTGSGRDTTSGCIEKSWPNCSCGDKSDAVRYKVLKPNGGERLTVGSIDTVKYCVDDAELLDKGCYDGILLQLSIDNGQTWHPLSPIAVGAGWCAWYIDEALYDENGTRVSMVGRTCLVKVGIYDSCGDPTVDFDVSDEAFTIVK